MVEQSFLNGFLKSLAIQNSFTNHGKTYTFSEIPDRKTIEEAILDYLGNPDFKVAVTDITTGWKEHLSSNLHYFLTFDLGVVAEKEISKTKKRQDPDYYQSINRYREELFHITERKYMLEYLLRMLENFGENQPEQVLSVEVDNTNAGWYEGYYKDFVFRINDRLYFLHFGDSD